MSEKGSCPHVKQHEEGAGARWCSDCGRKDPETPEQALLAACLKLVSEGKNIEAIREYRNATGCGLAAAQRALQLK